MTLSAIDAVLECLQELGELAQRAREYLADVDGHPAWSHPAPPGQAESAMTERSPTGARTVARHGALVDAARRDAPHEPSAARDPGARSSCSTAAFGNPDRGADVRLTPRQREVLELLARGTSNRRIGRILCITEQTVKAHLHMIYHKLGATDRTEAVVIALNIGLVEVDRTGPGPDGPNVAPGPVVRGPGRPADAVTSRDHPALRNRTAR